MADPKRFLAPALACTLGLSTLACSEDDSSCSDSVLTKADPTVDFTAIQTFALLPESDLPENPPPDLPEDTVTHIEAAYEAARSELVEIGLTEVDPATEDPDVWVFDVAATEDQDGVVWSCVGGWTWWGWWGWVWDPCAWLAPVPVTYSVGTMIIGLADAAQENVVFGGVMQGVLGCDSDIEGRIQSGVSRVFSDYPADQTGEP